MSQHTPEPWKTGTDLCSGRTIISTNFDGLVNYGIAEIEERNKYENARRIVACVNRLASFTTAQIEDFGYDLAGTSDWVVREARLRNRMIELENKNSELLAALNKAQEDINWMLNNRQFLNGYAFDYIAGTIAKCEVQS